MYTEQNRGFTVITNFGCDCHCKYCITKYHPILQNAVTDKSKIDWDYLEKCIASSEAPTVNLSGGGDPFYHWQENIAHCFYHNFFSAMRQGYIGFLSQKFLSYQHNLIVHTNNQLQSSHYQELQCVEISFRIFPPILSIISPHFLRFTSASLYSFITMYIYPMYHPNKESSL